MAITYTWGIQELEYSNDEINGVSAVHWYCRAEEDEHYKDVYGQIDLSYDSSSENFISYEDLTELTVLDWVFNHPSIDRVLTESILADQISAEKTPQTLTGKPWSLTPQATNGE